MLLNDNSLSAKLKNLAKRLFLGEKSYLWFCFGIPVAVMYLIYLALGIHPFGDGSVLVLDLNAQYVHFYQALREAVLGDESLLYSFGRQLGGEFMGIYAYYLASPLSYIVALFPKARILEALLTIFLLKTGLCGASFGFYLHKTTKPEARNKFGIIAFSMMYALCSYAIVHQSNTMWIDALIWLPLLTYGIEELIKRTSFKLFVVALAMTVMSNYYIGYMVCIYVMLYFFCYYVASSENGKNNLLGEKAHFIKSLARIAGYSLLALGIAAVIILTAYYSLTFGKLDFDNSSDKWNLQIRMDLMDLLTKFLPGSYDTVRRSGLPFVYCGVLTLLMLPVYYVSRKVSTREKIMYSLLILVFIISFMVNVVDLVWHGFSEPNWLNYRYSFMLSFIILTLAHKGFTDVETVGNRIPLAMAGFISLFLIVAQKYVFPSLNSEEGGKLDLIQCIGFTFVAMGLYLAILGMNRKPEKKQAVAILMIFVISIEMFANGISNVAAFDYDVVYSRYSSYNDFMNGVRPAVESVQKYDSSFYRMEKIDHRNTNDNMSLTMRGLSNSSSTLNYETVEVLRHMGYFSRYHKSSYLGGNPVSDSLLGVKYVLANNKAVDYENDENIEYEKENTKLLLDRYYEKLLTEGGYDAFYNKYALSIAFAVSSNTVDYTFKNENGKDINPDPYGNLNDMVSAMLGTEETVEIFKAIHGVEIVSSNCGKSVIENHTMYTPKDSSSRASVTYKTIAKQSGDVYLNIPSRYHRAVEITLNGDEYGSFYDDDTPRGFYLGYFNEGDEIRVRLSLKSSELYLLNGANVFYYLDQEVFEECFEELHKHQLILDDNYKEDHLTGVITTPADSQTVMTTIPYDEGWIVKVDGKEVKLSKSFDAFISFEIDDAGEHTVELIYRPDEFVYGAVCSTVCLVIFILLAVFEKKLRAIFHKNEITVPVEAIESIAETETENIENTDGE